MEQPGAPQVVRLDQVAAPRPGSALAQLPRVSGIPDDGIRLTEGQERTLCVSTRLPPQLLAGGRGGEVR
ncbi:hypothetical protein MNEG_4994, partial [Monoraphidium neglectum]